MAVLSTAVEVRGERERVRVGSAVRPSSSDDPEPAVSRMPRSAMEREKPLTRGPPAGGGGGSPPWRDEGGAGKGLRPGASSDSPAPCGPPPRDSAAAASCRLRSSAATMDALVRSISASSLLLTLEESRLCRSNT